jgi:hypothetical protein
VGRQKIRLKVPEQKGARQCSLEKIFAGTSMVDEENILEAEYEVNNK